VTGGRSEGYKVPPQVECGNDKKKVFTFSLLRVGPTGNRTRSMFGYSPLILRYVFLYPAIVLSKCIAADFLFYSCSCVDVQNSNSYKTTSMAIYV
jgi:hypothetical protein